MKIAAYYRQSKDRQGEEWAVSRQREDVERMAAARGMTIAAEFVDNDMSASNLKKPRPDFENMLARITEFDAIASKHIDRLLRKMIELERVLALCEPARVTIMTSADGVDTSTEAGRMHARILVAVAQAEVERKGARQVAAAKQAAEMGRWIGGKRPFGYEPNAMDIRPTEAAAIRIGYEAIIAGDSLYSVAQAWNRAGILTSDGNQWNGQLVRQMLLRHRYAGIRSYKGEPVGPALWAPIVTEDMWRTTAAILSRPERRQQESTARKYLLTGILLCGKCDAQMRSGLTDRTKQPVYRCKSCFRVRRVQAPVDATATALIIGFMKSPEAAELRESGKQSDTRQLVVEERSILDQIDEVAVDRAMGILNRRQVQIANERLREQLERVRAEIQLATRSNLFTALANADDPHAEWKSYSLDRKRAIIRGAVELKLDSPGGGHAFRPEHLRYRWLLAEE